MTQVKHKNTLVSVGDTTDIYKFKGSSYVIAIVLPYFTPFCAAHYPILAGLDR